MKKVLLLFAAVMIGLTTYAQQTGSPTWTRILEERPTTVDIQLVNASENHLQVHVKVPGFFTTIVNTERGEAQVISLPKSPNNYLAGEPDLPYIVIPSIIDDQSEMGIEVLASKYQDFEDVEVAPSKGDFSRQIDPATVPYTYGECYQHNAFIPDHQADLFEPYILRDFRGQNIVVKPFAYNPVTKTLRVYYDLTVEMRAVGKGGENVMNRKSQEVKMDPEFETLYSKKFINYHEVKNRYTPIGENGELLIICYESYMNAMEPFVTWKRNIGRPTEIIGTSVTGTTASGIQSYITSYYNSHPNLTHVLLVGDQDKIPGTYMSGLGDYSGYSDQRYGQLVGNDYYNDIFIGRFSANNAAQVTTQVNRTITYERDLNTSATWLKKGLGVSKKENGNGHNGEDDYEHIDLIRNDLLGYTYTTVYQEYAGVSGISSTTTTISNKINNGVGIINYCNHGSATSWQSHNYSNSHVNALTNGNMLPFIISTACLNGKYDYSSGDCFAEAWMHATNGSASTPTGAIGGIFSYISQPWIPPMEGQDEMNDILVESYSNNIKRTLGGVLTNGNMAVLDYSTSNAAKGTYLTWNIFGDPTLTLRTDTPANMTVSHPGTINIGQDTYTVQVPNGNGALATITYENGIMGSAMVVNGVATITLDEAPDEIADLTLCVFGYNKVTYLGTISVVGGAQYGITLGSCEHGTFEATPNPAYVGQTVTLTAYPETGYCLSEWHVTTNAKVQNVPVTNNQFVMPEGEVTVNATFVVGHTVTLSEVENGSITANPTTALQGTTITLTATPASGYTLGDWLVYKNGDLNTTLAVTDNQFVMPDYDVTVMAFFVIPAGGEITIGSGSNTSADLPTNVWYKFTTSQQIYTKAEIGDAGTITSISFNYNGNATSGTRSIDIYITHTTSSALFNWVAQSESNKVYSGTQTFTSNGWHTITLDTPFEYNGNDNLLITVDDNTGSYSGSSGRAFYIYSTGATRAIYYRNDTNHQNINNPSSSYAASTSTNNSQIKITKVTSSVASMALTSEVLDGFSYNEFQGPSEAQTFTIMGYVAEDITITAPADYEVSATETGTYSNTLTLPAPSGDGGLITSAIYVRLKAGLSIGDYNNEILTVSCDEVSKTVTLNGTVLNGYHWTLVHGQYANNMTLLGVILFDGVEQRSTDLEVGAFCGDEVRGIGKATYCPPVDRYILPLMVYGNDDDVITFKLYDPNVEEEFDSDPNLSYLFTTEGYGTITSPKILNFYTSTPPTPPQQSITLENGWKWISSYVAYDGNSLSNLENTITDSEVNAATIKSQTQYRTYEDGEWYGTMNSMENESMYMVQLDQSLEVTFSGSVVNPEEHPITLNKGWKWISFLSPTAMSLENALVNLNINEDDVIKGQGGFSTYSGTAWVGSLKNLEPGKGYMYQNMGDESLTLVYPATAKGSVAEDEVALHWKHNPYQFSHNLCLMVSLEGVTLSENSHEIGAFVNGECRGSARVEEVNGKVLAFLTVTGQDGETVRFKVYDVEANKEIEAKVEEQILFAPDALYGSLKQPYMLHLNANGVDSYHGQVAVFPNPSQAGTELHITTPNRDKTFTVEVIDLVGSVIRTEVLHDGILRGMERSGVYTLKVTNQDGVTYYGKLIINH